MMSIHFHLTSLKLDIFSLSLDLTATWCHDFIFDWLSFDCYHQYHDINFYSLSILLYDFALSIKWNSSTISWNRFDYHLKSIISIIVYSLGSQDHRIFGINTKISHVIHYLLISFVSVMIWLRISYHLKSIIKITVSL